MKEEQFKGYILEEIIAYLIRSNGYTLINEAKGNDDLRDGHNGLNLKGRGAMHQIDVLGELNWIPSFSFPLRLIVEAKFRNKPVGINVIREAIGILADVNQNFFVTKDAGPKPRYCYASVVFSATGFSENAVDMAVAHQIQLSDLSGDEYSTLRTKINEFTTSVFGSSTAIDKTIFKGIITHIKNKLRGMNIANQTNHIRNCNLLINSIKESYQELFIGMSQGGFMLLLNANDTKKFLSYAKRSPNHKININRYPENNSRTRIITPNGLAPDNHEYYKLSFKLPLRLHDRIFNISNDMLNEALNQKKIHFPKISIYYQSNNKGYLFNLEYQSIVQN